MLTKFIEWLTKPQLSELEYYVTSNNPKNEVDVEQLIKEFNYKRRLQCF